MSAPYMLCCQQLLCLGGCDGLLYALIAFVVVDYITGVMCAAADRKLSSEVGISWIVFQNSFIVKPSFKRFLYNRKSDFPFPARRQLWPAG